MKRPFVSSFIALTFVVMAVTGILSFVREFSLVIVGVHALSGMVFIGVVGCHVSNNFRSLRTYFRGRSGRLAILLSLALTTTLVLQPGPIKALLGLSGNLGPAMDRFEMSENGVTYHYNPAPEYRLTLTVRAGHAFDVEKPPAVAIWLENQGGYHIKTLRAPSGPSAELLPYWTFKVDGWEAAKLEAEEEPDVDGVSAATPNGSFDPADYILPGDPTNATPYTLLIEVNQLGDVYREVADQPSLVYSVEIDNLSPRSFQVLELMGYPKREDVESKEAWNLYFVDGGFGSALELIDSSLLTIDRKRGD